MSVACHLLCLKQGLFGCFATVHTKFDSLVVSVNSSLLVSHLTPGVWRLQMHAAIHVPRIQTQILPVECLALGSLSHLYSLKQCLKQKAWSFLRVLVCSKRPWLCWTVTVWLNSKHAT